MDLAISSQNQCKPKLLLVDGTSIVRRVFEAVKGEDTPGRAEGALNSSWGSFMRALREHEPTHFLAAFDHGGETWRHRLYPQYKVDRKPMSANLSAALPGFLERLNNAGMRTLRVPDVEADDTLTTLALKAVERGFDVVLLASDKDLYRLLSNGVRIYDHFQSEWRDAVWVQDRYGVTPDKMTDFLALMGDDVDGIPGVDGVGEKLAARLLNTHGDLEGVIAAAGDIKGKLGERIRESFEVARLSRQLATMRTDVPLGVTPREIQLPAALVAHIQTMPAPRLVRTTPMAHEVGQAHHAAQSQEAPAATQSRRLRM
jgi:5'-3' exonuclease